MNRVVEPKDMLPVEVPVSDVNEPLCGAVGQRRFAEDVAPPIMRVRLDGLNVDVNRQQVRVGDRVLRVAGWNVDVLPAEAQHRRRARGRRVTEVQTDRRLDTLAAAARLSLRTLCGERARIRQGRFRK